MIMWSPFPMRIGSRTSRLPPQRMFLVNLSDMLAAVVIASFANCAAIEAFHHGEIFARLRAWLETRKGFLPELMSCPFCLSYWTPLPLLLLCLWHDLTFYQLPALVPLSFAVTRMSNLLNDALHTWCPFPCRSCACSTISNDI